MVADDPVLAAQFFHVYIQAFLQSFLGFETKPSADHKPKGPLLNETIFTGLNSRGLSAFYGTVETQGRGSLHLHMLVWLHGAPQPKTFMKKMNKDKPL